MDNFGRLFIEVCNCIRQQVEINVDTLSERDVLMSRVLNSQQLFSRNGERLKFYHSSIILTACQILCLYSN